MENLQFHESVEYWANLLLVWVGFGTLVGLLAKAIMPGRDPGGSIATLAMGIGGAVFGCGILKYFWNEMEVTPISPVGLVVATGGAFVILFFYRLLGGFWFVEGEHPHQPRLYARRRRRLADHDI